MLPKPRADLKPNTADFERLPLVKPTGFREYDARWLFPDEAVQMLLPCWGVFAFTVVQLFSARRSEATAERRFMTPFYIVIAALVAYVGLQSTVF